MLRNILRNTHTMTLDEMTIQEAHAGLAAGDVSAQDLTQACLNAIDERDDEIHAFLEVYRDDALEQAQRVDAKIAAGEPIGDLAGIPIAIKDNMCLRGKRVTAGSKMLERYVSPYDATAVAKLKEAGAVIIGRTNMDEFAMGSSTEHSAYGLTNNPHDLNRVPGGSSGGSAAAVAAGMCLGALGSDTGGSIRQPASFCGIVGMKPSYGRVSRHGLIAMGSSLDQIGPLARSVTDAGRLYDVLQGVDGLDATTTSFASAKTPDTLRVGVPQEYFGEGLDPSIAEAVRSVVTSLEQEGVVVQEVSLPHTSYALATYYIIMPSEVSANLARYDNVRYAGLRDKPSPASDLLAAYKEARARGLGGEVRRRVMLGTYALSAGYYEAYYGRAQRVRALIRSDFDTVFEDVDVLVTPTSPTFPFVLGDRTDDPLAMYLSDIYTVTANLAGIPGISVPLPDMELPAGVQVLAPHGHDDHMLSVAARIEKLPRGV